MTKKFSWRPKVEVLETPLYPVQSNRTQTTKQSTDQLVFTGTTSQELEDFVRAKFLTALTPVLKATITFGLAKH